MNCIGQRQHQVPTCTMHRKMKTLPAAITYATSGKQFRILDYTAQYNGAHAVNLLIIIRAVGSGRHHIYRGWLGHWGSCMHPDPASSGRAAACRPHAGVCILILGPRRLLQRFSSGHTPSNKV